jgi:hypothetical protein
VKGLLNDRVPISEVPAKVERTCNHAKEKHSAIKFIKNWTLELTPTMQALFLQSVKGDLTTYAFTYLCKEFHQSVNYTVHDVEGRTGVLTVRRVHGFQERTLDGDHNSADGVKLDPNKYLRSERRVFLMEGFPVTCSCQVMTFMGLFCRHMLAVIIIKQLQPKFKEGLVEIVMARWLQENNGKDANIPPLTTR